MPNVLKRNNPVTYYVVFSPIKGIYLGEGCWSLIKNGHGKEVAPVYGIVGGRLIMARMHEDLACRLQPVYPDTQLSESPPLQGASEKACVNAGFKHWNPESFKVNHK